MDWQKQVPGCMAAGTAPFGSHPKDEERAKAAISNAKESGASFDDFAKEVVWHCYQNGFQKEAMNEQVERVRRMWR